MEDKTQTTSGSKTAPFTEGRETKAPRLYMLKEEQRSIPLNRLPPGYVPMSKRAKPRKSKARSDGRG
jgi:hypothetical protein